MTNAELKQALLNKTPVTYNGIRYRRVYEICYRAPDGKIIILAGLLDKNGNCIVYAKPEKVEPVQEERSTE